jgi:hypothetical protein
MCESVEAKGKRNKAIGAISPHRHPLSRPGRTMIPDPGRRPMRSGRHRQTAEDVFTPTYQDRQEEVSAHQRNDEQDS